MAGRRGHRARGGRGRRGHRGLANWLRFRSAGVAGEAGGPAPGRGAGVPGRGETGRARRPAPTGTRSTWIPGRARMPRRPSRGTPRRAVVARPDGRTAVSPWAPSLLISSFSDLCTWFRHCCCAVSVFALLMHWLKVVELLPEHGERDQHDDAEQGAQDTEHGGEHRAARAHAGRSPGLLHRRYGQPARAYAHDQGKDDQIDTAVRVAAHAEQRGQDAQPAEEERAPAPAGGRTARGAWSGAGGPAGRAARGPAVSWRVAPRRRAVPGGAPGGGPGTFSGGGGGASLGAGAGGGYPPGAGPGTLAAGLLGKVQPEPGQRRRRLLALRGRWPACRSPVGGPRLAVRGRAGRPDCPLPAGRPVPSAAREGSAVAADSGLLAGPGPLCGHAAC